MPHTSILGDADSLIVPRESAIFPHGDAIVLAGRGHNALLFDPDSITHVVERVKRAQQQQTSATLG